MTLLQARIKARKYSYQYNTFWYVRLIDSNTGGDYQPWAHSSDDQRTVAIFYCGKDVD